MFEYELVDCLDIDRDQAVEMIWQSWREEVRNTITQEEFEEWVKVKPYGMLYELSDEDLQGLLDEDYGKNEFRLI